jgi:hypothetical protein
LLHFCVLEESRDEFPLLLQHLSHIGHGDLRLDVVTAIIIVVAVSCGFRLIVVVIGNVIFTLASVDLGLW